MKISLVVIGKSKFSFVEEALDHYGKNIRHFAEFEVIELKDQSSQKDREAATLQTILKKKIDEGRAKIVLLDERGKQYSSIQFSQKISQWRDAGLQKLFFVIGGAYGFTEEIRVLYPDHLSLSSFTLPHDLVRVFLSEQIYRALHILSGGKYHHEG